MRSDFIRTASFVALTSMMLVGCGHEQSNTASPTGNSSASTAPDDEEHVNALKKREDQLNDKCRGGSGDDPATEKACDDRDKVFAQLKDAGWCWGTPDQIEADKTWVKCGGSNTPAQASTPASDPDLAAAEEIVREYYIGAGSPDGEDPLRTANAESLFAPELLRLYRAAVAATPKGDEGPIDFDIRSGGQDPDIKHLTFSTIRSADGALVTAKFQQWGKPTKINYDLVQFGSGWRIADISEDANGQSPAWDLTELLNGPR